MAGVERDLSTVLWPQGAAVSSLRLVASLIRRKEDAAVENVI